MDAARERPPNHVTIGSLLFLLLALAYLERAGISFAIVPMGREFHLSPSEKGVILAAFSWGYVGAMTPAGWLTDRIGGSRILLLAVWVWTAISWLCAAAAHAWHIAVLRVALGIAEAPVSPAAAQTTTRHYPPEQRGRGMATFDGGSYLGLAAGAPLVGFVGAVAGWRWTFVLLGVSAVAWGVSWRWTTRHVVSLPQPITSERDAAPTTLSRIIRQPVVHILGAGFFCYNYFKSFFLTWFPSYMIEQKGFSERTTGIIGAVPGILALVSVLFAGVILDRLVAKRRDAFRAERLFAMCGLMATSAIWPLGIEAHGCWSLLLLGTAFAACIAISPAIWSMISRVAPEAESIGRVGGVQNTISNAAGIIAPIITGVLVQSTGDYNAALFVTGVITFSGALLYLLVGQISHESYR